MLHKEQWLTGVGSATLEITMSCAANRLWFVQWVQIRDCAKNDWGVKCG